MKEFLITVHSVLLCMLMLFEYRTANAQLCELSAQEIQKISCENHSSSLFQNSQGITAATLATINKNANKYPNWQESKINELAWQKSVIDKRLAAIEKLHALYDSKHKNSYNSNNQEFSKNSDKVRQLAEILEREEIAPSHNLVRQCDKKGCDYKKFMQNLRRQGEDFFADLLADYKKITSKSQCNTATVTNVNLPAQNCSIENYIQNYKYVEKDKLTKRLLLASSPYLASAEEKLKDRAKSRKGWEMSHEDLSTLTQKLYQDHVRDLQTQMHREKRDLQELRADSEKLQKTLAKIASNNSYQIDVEGNLEDAYLAKVVDQHRKLIEVSQKNTGFLEWALAENNEVDDYAKYGKSFCSGLATYKKLFNESTKDIDDILFFIPGVGLLTAKKQYAECQSYEYRFNLDPSQELYEQKNNCWEQIISNVGVAIASSVGGAVGVVGKMAKGVRASQKLLAKTRIKRATAKAKYENLKNNSALQKELEYEHKVTNTDFVENRERLVDAEKVLNRKLSRAEQESIIRAHKLCRHQVNDELLGKGILKNSKIPPKCSAYKQYILRATLDSDDADLLIDVKNLVHHKKMIAGYHFAEKDIVGHKKYVQGNRASRLSIQEINETEFVKVTTGEGNNWEVIVKIDSQGKRNYFRRPANSQVDWQPVTNKDSQFIENIKEAAVFDKPITSTVSRGNSATSHVAQKVQSINPSSGDVVYVDIEGGGRAVATFVKKSDGEEVLRFADPRKGFSEVEVAVKNADAKGIHNIEPHGLYAKKSSTTQSHVKEPPTETAKAIDSPGVQVSKPNLTATKPATPESAQIPRVTANTPIENLRPPENIHSRVYNEQWLPVKENYLNMRERAAQAADKLKNAEKEQATAQRIYERNKPAFDGFSNYRNANIEYLKTQKQLQQLEDRISASKKTVNIKNKHLDRKIEKARKQEALAEKYKQFSAGLRSATRENAERAKLADSHVANRQAELLQRQTKGDTAQSTPGKIAEEQRQLRLQQQVHYREAQPDFNVEEAKSAYESLNNTRHQLRILEQQRMKGDSELASMIEEQQKLKRQMDSHKRRMDVNAHHHKNVDKDRYTRVIDRVRAAERSLSESREQLATAQANEQRAKKMLIDRHHQLKGHK